MPNCIKQIIMPMLVKYICDGGPDRSHKSLLKSITAIYCLCNQNTNNKTTQWNITSQWNCSVDHVNAVMTPVCVVQEMARVLQHPRVFSFLHVPVQSASDSVLMDMKREYCCADFRRVVDFLKEKWVHCDAYTTNTDKGLLAGVCHPCAELLSFQWLYIKSNGSNEKVLYMGGLQG